MAKRGANNLFLKIIYNKKFIAFLGLLIILLISYPLAKSISKNYKASQEIKELEKEISVMESQNKSLKKAIEILNSEEYLEEQARINLGLKKQGEEVAVIKKESAAVVGGSGEVQESEKAPNNKNVSNYLKWWNYFFRK